MLSKIVTLLTLIPFLLNDSRVVLCLWTIVNHGGGVAYQAPPIYCVCVCEKEATQTLVRAASLCETTSWFHIWRLSSHCGLQLNPPVPVESPAWFFFVGTLIEPPGSVWWWLIHHEEDENDVLSGSICTQTNPEFIMHTHTVCIRLCEVDRLDLFTYLSLVLSARLRRPHVFVFIRWFTCSEQITPGSFTHRWGFLKLRMSEEICISEIQKLPSIFAGILILLNSHTEIWGFWEIYISIIPKVWQESASFEASRLWQNSRFLNLFVFNPTSVLYNKKIVDRNGGWWMVNVRKTRKSFDLAMKFYEEKKMY